MKREKPATKKKTDEVKYYGFHACLRLWKERPDDIIRVYVEEGSVKELSPLLKWCASKKKAYHILPADEMVKVSDSVHHEGLSILAKELPTTSFPEMMQFLRTAKGPSCLLFLDGVQNPHNIGSIMRVAAHFGVSYILGEKGLIPKISPSTYRIAQGGAECVKLIALDNLKNGLQELKKIGFLPVASSSHGGKELYDYTFSPRTLLILGSESEGVKNRLLQGAKETIVIPGSGLVESLNVSVATGLLLGEYYRQMRTTR